MAVRASRTTAEMSFLATTIAKVGNPSGIVVRCKLQFLSRRFRASRARLVWMAISLSLDLFTSLNIDAGNILIY